MSLSVERLKALLAYENEWLAMYAASAALRQPAPLEVMNADLHRESATAYAELIAIKEAEPVGWGTTDPNGRVNSFTHMKPAPKMDGSQYRYLVALIRKPE